MMYYFFDILTVYSTKARGGNLSFVLSYNINFYKQLLQIIIIVIIYRLTIIIGYKCRFMV